MEQKDIVYEKRPLHVELDDATKTFSELMNNISIEANSHWSFSGGFARDLWLGKAWNDYDVCSNNTPFIQMTFEEMGLLERGEQEGSEIPHDYYVDPYDFNRTKYPIHWIRADDEWAFAPRHFDFSINQICLKPDGYFYAPTYTWRDLDRKIIRKIADRMTTNIAMRAIRFAAKYDFTLHETMVEQINEHIANPMDTLLLKRNAQKMVDDGVEKKSFEIMRKLNWPKVDECENLEDYIGLLDKMVVLGEGYREPIEDPYADD